MNADAQHIFKQAQQWLRQEQAWDSQLYEGGNGRGGEREKNLLINKTAVAPHPPLTPSPTPSLPSERHAALQALYSEYKDCVRCPLGPSRIRFVFGVGNPTAKVMFIGEGPGYEEDRRGEPFVGKAGQLLDKMMASIGLSRQTNAYIANIVKCHPMTDPSTPDARANDRPPTPEEVATCSPILLRQIAVIQPKVIVTLGSPSTKMMLKTAEGISKIRGRLVPFAVDAFYPETGDSANDSAPPLVDAKTRDALRVIQVLPTYHPAALLRNPNLKVDAWTDLKLLRDTFLKTAV